MTLGRPQLVLLDVDGTLVDSVPDLAFSVDAMLAQLQLPARGEAAVRNWVGNGVERLVKRALTGRMDAEPPGPLYERALPIFMQIYQQHVCVHSRCFPGVHEGLEYLASAGFVMGSVTNKAGQFTRPLLQALGIIDYFEVVVSGDDTVRKKPDPMPLLYAAEHTGIAPQQCLMVGDSKSDVKAARAAGFQIVCVSYGYNHGEDIRDSCPDGVIDSLIELRGLLPRAA